MFIAVGTPAEEDGSADLSHVLGVARDIARALRGYTLIVAKSTVPPGTAARLREVVGRETTHPFGVVSNPEFLKQGAAIEDFMRPDRVVVGADDPRAAEIMRSLYAPFTRTGAPILVMDCASAELSKYAANAMLATRVSFMNEMANVCEQLRGRHRPGPPRGRGRSPHRAGVPLRRRGLRRELLSEGRPGPRHARPRQRAVRCRILEAVQAVNASQKLRLVDKMAAHFTSLEGRTIALWGLAFKPKTDDMREAPSIAIAAAVLERGGRVVAYDPQAGRTARRVLDARVAYAATAYDALEGADALAIVTEWNEFREPDFARMRALMRSPTIFDGRNLFAPERMRAAGFTYVSIGR